MAPISTLTVKLQAQIAEFQGEFREAQKEVQKFQDGFEATATKASAYGNLIARGVEFGIQAFGNLAREALASASKIEDMSRKTGLSMRAIQEFQHVADQTGTTIDAFSSAAFQLGTRLAGGSGSVVSALEDLGLEFKHIRDLRPDEQFDLIAQALGRMEDPQERNRIGLELFGRRFQEIAPAIAEGYRSIADGAAKMSDDTVTRLAKAEDAWARLSRSVTIASGEILAATFTAVDRATRSWADFFDSLNPGGQIRTIARGIEAEAAASAPNAPRAPALFDIPSLNASRQALLDMVEPTRTVRVELARLGTESRRAAQAQTDFSDQLRNVQREVDSVERAVFDAGEEYERTAIKIDYAAVAQSYFQRVNDAMRPSLQAVKVDVDAIAESYRNLGTRSEEAGEQTREVSARFERLADDLKAIGFRAARTFAEGIAEGIRSGDWGAVGQAFEDAMGEAMASGMAAAVNFFVPGLGDALKPIFDAISSKITSAFDFNEGRDLVQDFAKSFGGFDALHARLLEMGAAGEALWIKLTQGVGRDNPEQARRVIDEIKEALEEFGTEAERAAARMDAIGVAIEGINAKATLFAAPFQALIDKQKEGKITQDEFTASLAALGEKGQAEFERIGLFAAAAFAGMVKETGDAIGALDRLSPALSVLQQGLKDFGLTSTGTIDALLGLFKLVHDETTGPILQAIQATGQIFAGLQDAGILTSELFQTVSDDIGAAFRELEAKGGDVSKAMALSQPVLQRLWEAQKTYGRVTDETTQKILDQAEQQGLVGDHMKDVNRQILDVLLAIADVFGAKIPESMRNTRDAATDTARQIEDEFKKIEIPTIKIPYIIEGSDDMPRYYPGVPHMAEGGIVRRRTLALIGEKEPEAVIPLSRLGSMVPEAGSTTVVLQMDGRDMAEVVVPHIPGVARKYVRV